MDVRGVPAAAQRLLARLRAQGFVLHDLSRACLGQAKDSIPRVILLGRLSLYGRRAERLHEEIVPVTTRWIDEKRQLESDVRSWRARLDQFERDLAEEPDRIRDFYEVKATRIGPKGACHGGGPSAPRGAPRPRPPARGALHLACPPHQDRRVAPGDRLSCTRESDRAARSGFRFYFFSREEPRAHVHVQHADGEAKFWIEPVVGLQANYGLKPKQLAEAEQLVEEHVHEIRAAWAKHFPG